MAKITMKNQGKTTIAEALEEFLISKENVVANGTYTFYKRTLEYLFREGSKFGVGLDDYIEELNQKQVDTFYKSFVKKGLSNASVKTYGRALKAFFNWSKEECYCDIKITLIKGQTPPKETYTKEELEKLLKKPNVRKCRFNEYRDWVIINLLLNCGCRAGTIRNIRIKDVDFDNNLISYFHTKGKQLQVVPMCSALKKVLKEYLRVRGGEPTDFLFPTENNTQLTEGGLINTIKRYNKRRGVERTSIHAFRHTFAKFYLLECGGDAFTLQRILGHSTLEMTKNYCTIYNAELVNNFNSPLTQLTNSERIRMRA